MNRIKSLSFSLLASAVTILGMAGGQAMAAGNASLSLGGGSYSTGNSFAVPVYVNSGADPVNVVQADFSYNPSLMQFQGVSCGGAFGITAGAGANSVSCGVSGGATVTGSQLVATINFKALSGGSSVANIASTSHVYRSTDNADIWNGVATATGFSFTSPAPVTRTPVAPVASATTAATTDTPVTAAPAKTAVKKPVQHKVIAAAPVKASNTGSWILIAILVLALAAVAAATAWAARHPKQYRTYKKKTNRFVNNNLTQPSKRLYKQGLQLMPFTK